VLDRVYGCLVGTAIGDAMGMPASFMTPEQIRHTYGRIDGFLKPAEQQKAHADLVKGEITDDTEESLIISSVIIEAGKFDESLFIKKMRQWAIEKSMLGSTVIGPSTRKFLEAIVKGDNYLEVGKYGDTNGAAMRVAPIGLANHGNVEKAIEEATTSALPSHGSKPGVAAACAVAAAIALAAEGNCTVRDVVDAAVYGAKKGEEAGFDICAPSVSVRIRLAQDLVERHAEKSLDDICYILYQHIGAGMKSYESVPLSLGVFYAACGNFEQGVVSVINVGDDADTNGAIVGGLCGAYSGAVNIRPDWMDYISQQNKLDFKQLAKSLWSIGLKR
jgi:ADP-ribosylglycohydrolase